MPCTPRWSWRPSRGGGSRPSRNRGAPGLQHSGYVSQGRAPLRSPGIRFAGQVVAVVVADTPEAADEGAALLRCEYMPAASAGTACRSAWATSWA